MNKFLLVMVALLLIPALVLGANNDSNSGGSGGGLPDRVALVEKVLEVEHLTKQPQAEILGTDYLPNDEGKLQAYLKVGENPLENAVCYVSVLYPNMTYFIENQLMFDIAKPFFEGLYYYDFVVPFTTGVYPVNAYCFYDANIIRDYVISYSITDYDKSPPSLITDLNNLDNEVFIISDKASCNNNNCSWNVTIEYPIGFHTDLLSDARISLVAEQTKNVNLRWWVYYPYENEFDYWFNMSSLGVIYSEQYVVNHSRENNTEIQVGFHVFDSQGDVIDIDLLRSDRIYNGSYVSDLRGNNELVVSNRLYNTTEAIYEIVNAEISVISNDQLGQFLLITGFLILLFVGLMSASALIGLAYSFIYLDGLLAIGGAVICVMLLYFGERKRRKK